MIRKLTADDNTFVMSFLRRESSFNLFIIGDIENFGYESSFQDLWAEFDADNNLCAVLLRYYRYYVMYAPAEYDAQGFADIIVHDNAMEMVSGKQVVLDSLAETLPVAHRRDFYFAELADATMLDGTLRADAVEKVSLNDVEDIFRLYAMIDEFNSTPSSNAAFRKNMASGSGRTYGYRVDGSFVALASTAAENSLSAMVVGVCTHPEHRNRGYATLCVTALCREVLNERRTLSLFYDNPKAGAIYRRIGFRTIGMWTVLDVQRKNG